MEKVRNGNVDILRTIGVLFIILAHCSIPNWLYEFREFDVVLLVFLSAISFNFHNFDFTCSNYKKYIGKRFFHIVFIPWCFLIFFFIFVFIFDSTYEISVSKIVSSFLLFSAGSIGYVWIFRIMMVNALFNPFFQRLTKSYNHYSLYIYSVLLIIVNDFMYQYIFSDITNKYAKSLLVYSITYTIGYGVISIIAMTWFSSEHKVQKTITGLTFFLFVGYFYLYYHIPMIQYKYPPQGYYISYGLLVSMIAFHILDKCNPNKKTCQLISWFSKNSMNIYLAHIFILQILHHYSFSYYILYPILASSSVFLVYYTGKVKIWWSKK